MALCKLSRKEIIHKVENSKSLAWGDFSKPTIKEIGECLWRHATGKENLEIQWKETGQEAEKNLSTALKALKNFLKCWDKFNEDQLNSLLFLCAMERSGESSPTNQQLYEELQHKSDFDSQLRLVNDTLQEIAQDKIHFPIYLPPFGYLKTSGKGQLPIKSILIITVKKLDEIISQNLNNLQDDDIPIRKEPRVEFILDMLKIIGETPKKSYIENLLKSYT